DGTTLSLFRNGVLVASRPGSGPVAAAPGAVASSTSTLQIGASQFGEYFNGLIDEVRVYDRALSPPDIQALSGPVASVPIASVTASPASATIAVDRKSTRLNSSHVAISYAVFCLKKKKQQ